MTSIRMKKLKKRWKERSEVKRMREERSASIAQCPSETKGESESAHVASA